MLTCSLQLQPLQILTKLLGELRPLQRKFHRRLQHSELVPCIEALTLKRVAEDLLFLGQGKNAVRELNLSARAGLGLLKQLEDTRRQDVAADDGLL